ncbi:hypothetical protein NFI96_011454, partial [Prochilodus magdalenae]
MMADVDEEEEQEEEFLNGPCDKTSRFELLVRGEGTVPAAAHPEVPATGGEVAALTRGGAIDPEDLNPATEK